MYKTWICTIFGGGMPTYLVSAESEKRAWELIRDALNRKFGWFYLTEYNCGGLIPVDGWNSDAERADDLNEMYSDAGVLKKGSFKDFVK